MQLLIMKQDRGVHYKGDIIEVRASGSPFGGEEPNSFVIVEVPNLPMTDFEGYNRAWEREIDFEIVASSPPTDSFRLRLFAILIKGTLGSISKADVEAFINSWGGSVYSYGDNEVIFDIAIYNALKSQAFWDITVNSIIFTEVSYNQTTGIHRVKADYSALKNNPTYVERFVKGKGLSIISHADKQLIYDANRLVVRDVFQKDIQEKIRRTVRRRRYCIPESVVDTIISNGGMVSTNETTLATYIIDKAI
jgi:hypothetical protein